MTLISVLMDEASATIIVSSGVIGHLVFNRLEPRNPIAIISLLLGPPVALALYLRNSYSNVISALVSCYIIYLGTLSSSVVAYRLSPFHPLASYPGPLICKVTRLWVSCIILTGDQYLYYKSLHARYGTHVRTGPNHLLICDAEAIPKILGAKGFPRGSRYDIGKLPGTTGSLLSLRDIHGHAQRRRIWDRSLNTTAVQGYQDMLVQRINQLASALESQKGEINISSWFSFFSFDFMGDLAFGGAFKMMEQGADEGNSMRNLRNAALSAEAAGAIPWLRPFITMISRFNVLRDHLQFAKECVLSRSAKGTTRKDIFYYLLDEDGEGSGPLSLPTLILESSLAIIAGSDTTGTALSNMFYYLISNPKAFNCLQAEVDTTFPSGSDTSAPDLVGDMKFLNAVINETLRLQPAVPSGVQRELRRGEGGAMIAGRWVPESTTVQVPSYTIHRDPRYVSPDPEDFRPERWLGPLEGGDYNLQTSAIIPFSYGPMNCPGKYLALQEIRMVTCALMQRFEFEFAPGWDASRWEKNLSDCFILAKGAMPVILKARK